MSARAKRNAHGSEVLLTGVAGRIGTILRERLPSYGWSLRLFDREPLDGGLRGDVPDHAALDAAVAESGPSTWLSPDDCARLVNAALRSPTLSYALAWRVSANTRRWWSLDAGRAIGYEPTDDAETFASTLRRGAHDPSDGPVGGGFTSRGFGIDEVAATWRA